MCSDEQSALHPEDQPADACASDRDAGQARAALGADCDPQFKAGGVSELVNAAKIYLELCESEPFRFAGSAAFFISRLCNYTSDEVLRSA